MPHQLVVEIRVETLEASAAGCGATMPTPPRRSRVDGVERVNSPTTRRPPPLASDQSRYIGTTLRVGRRTGIAESKAIGADGKVAIIARTTAYRC